MTPEQQIDANIRAILQAWASDGDKATAQENMRTEMRRIMSESYIKGTQDNFDALVSSGRLNK